MEGAVGAFSMKTSAPERRECLNPSLAIPLMSLTAGRGSNVACPTRFLVAGK
jgi:hypothetical protein